MKASAVQYAVGYLKSWQEFSHKVENYLTEADRPDLIIYPEYSAMELASLFSKEVQANVHLQVQHLQRLLPKYTALHQILAQKYQCYIVAGSFPVQTLDKVVNRAYVFAPSGSYDYQDKIIMTRFEKEQWGIAGGTQLKVFKASWGTFGVNICYDSEFPLLAHAQAQIGVNLIAVPSCTDTTAGYYRVHIGARARALENQCYVVQAPLVGSVDWSEAIDMNVGQAGFYAPIDSSISNDGILNSGKWNTGSVVSQYLDFSLLQETRHNGQVLNAKDWHTQLGANILPAITLV